MSPYTLPEGNVAIAFSGGRTSAYMLRQIIDTNGLDAVNSERVVVSFQNTGREMPETLDFVQECGERWGVRIVWLEYRPTKPWHEVVSHNSASREGEPFDALIAKRRMLPNIDMRFCTEELKIKTARRYCRSLGWQGWTTARGIRADEARRAQASRDKRIANWHPLIDAGVTKTQVAEFWRGQPFGLRLPHLEHGNPFGNCDGCFLKSEADKAALIRDYPARAEWWASHERKIGATFRHNMDLTALAAFIDRQGDWIFDTEGALCQADGGECFG